MDRPGGPGQSLAKLAWALPARALWGLSEPQLLGGTGALVETSEL